MNLKQHRLARTKDFFGQATRPQRQQLPTLKKQQKFEGAVVDGNGGRNRLRLPSLLRKPLLPTSVNVSLSGWSDRPLKGSVVESGDDCIRQKWLPGQRWRLGELIGSGTCGEIFKALLPDSGRTVAVKRIERSCPEPQEIEEIRILKMLRHKNIVEFYGSESTHQHRLIFMEYVSERSLSHVVADYGPLEEVTVKLYLRQVLEAVAYMHRKGIVHRDIKASNVLVGGDGQIKLSDFGCATNSNSQNCTFNGSVLWTAPETLKQGRYSPSSDVWSIGCLVIELLTGRSPWTERCFDNEMCAIYEIGSMGSRPAIPSGLSRPLADIIGRCLELEPEKRASCRSLLEHSYFN